MLKKVKLQKSGIVNSGFAPTQETQLAVLLQRPSNYTPGQMEQQTDNLQ
jgi:hypothetical protein